MSFEIRQGDVLDTLRKLPANHFHGCLTDPPYGLSSSDKRSPQRKSGVEQNRKGFMGMEWGGNVPGQIVWRELLRTLRPGANLLAFGGTRTHHRLMCAIEDAGFEIRDCIPARGADKGGASRFFYCAKASASERDGNNHPTVKPLKLTEYLARLILPPCGDERRRIVCPYSGSGSEMLGSLAAGWEGAVGIESDAGYIAIAERRLEEAAAA